jgi:hypothetical protein
VERLATKTLKGERAADPVCDAPVQLARGVAEANRSQRRARLSATVSPHPAVVNYILGVVLFSVSLFFAGMSTEAQRHPPANVTLTLGYLCSSAR